MDVINLPIIQSDQFKLQLCCPRELLIRLAIQLPSGAVDSVGQSSANNRLGLLFSQAPLYMFAAASYYAEHQTAATTQDELVAWAEINLLRIFDCAVPGWATPAQEIDSKQLALADEAFAESNCNLSLIHI